MAVNLKRFDTKTKANAGTEMELVFIGSGEKSGAFITVLGTDSDEWRLIKDERARLISDRAMAGDMTDLTADEKDGLICDALARCTKGWRGLETDAGPIEFSQVAAKKLYLDMPAIREQVNAFVGKRENFTLA